MRARGRQRSFLLAALVTLAMLAPVPPGPGPVQAEDMIEAKIDPDLLSQMTADPSAFLPVIVEMAHLPAPDFPTEPAKVRAQQAVDLLAAQALEGHAEAVGGLALVNAAAGWADATAIAALSLDAGVAFIHLDSLVQPRRGPKEPLNIWPPGLLSAPYPRVVRADKLWLKGITGHGVSVAILDSGVEDHQDLAGRIVARANFAGAEGDRRDPGGHGTHVAGIAAGDGALSEKEYVGIAPRAGIVDVRVLNGNGNGRVSSVVRGIEWVLDHAQQYNIRAISLSLGAPARRSYRLDPLAAAVEIAWKRGLVVVAAAGNTGPDGGTVETPGIDPYVVTVGATDDQGSLPVDDDELAWFSAWGTPHGPSPKPDLVAPGRRIVSLHVPGSHLDLLFGAERVVLAKNGTTYFRLTGTSMSTPVVSAAVALVLQQQPGLNPDQVKAILTGTTQPYGQSDGAAPPPDPSADGSGLLDAYAAAHSEPLGEANQGLRPADGLARTLYPILFGQPLEGVDWDDLAWDDLAWDDLAWDDLAWDDLAWDSLGWNDLAWDDLAWDRTGWDSLAWDSLTLD